MMVACSLGDFLRRIAFDAVSHGYVRYVVREIPMKKDPALVDRKLTQAYEITSCRTKRMRRRRQGYANVVGVRWGHSFVLLASPGQHPAFERLQNYDIRTTPLHFCGYSVGVVSGQVSVRVARKRWRVVQKQFFALSLREKEFLEEALASLPYYHFPGVLAQRRSLVAAINARRKPAGLAPVVNTIPDKLSTKSRGSALNAVQVQPALLES